MCIKAATKVLFFFLFTKSFAVFFQTANNSSEVFSENMEMTIRYILLARWYGEDKCIKK